MPQDLLPSTDSTGSGTSTSSVWCAARSSAENADTEPSFRVDGPQADRLPPARLRRRGAGGELRRQPRRRGPPQRAAVQLPGQQRRAAHRGAHQAGVRLPADGRRHPDDLRRRRVRRPSTTCAPAHPRSSATRSTSSACDEPWRRRIFDYVARLVQLRGQQRRPRGQRHRRSCTSTSTTASASWSGGAADAGSERPGRRASPTSPTSAQRRPAAAASTWCRTGPRPPPAGNGGRSPRSATCPTEWAGREPIFAWEAKVYALVDG